MQSSDAPPAQTYATPADLLAWAEGVMARDPDVIIGEAARPYMRRWWVVPRNEGLNVYLHEILRSDDDRALHDHPWDNYSMLLDGRYVEHTPEGQFTRLPGEHVWRPATAQHRLEILPGERAVSLFMTGPKVREWGFHCPNGWVHWEVFTATDAAGHSVVGRGCGE